jgi:hypothetical protein
VYGLSPLGSVPGVDKIRLLKAILVVLLCAGAVMAGTVVSVITFDDAPTPEPAYGLSNVWGTLPASYAGYTWSGWEVLNGAADTVLYQGSIPPPEGSNSAYPSVPASGLWVNSESPFQFLAAELQAWPYTSASSASSVVIYGFLNGDFVGSIAQDVFPTIWVRSNGIASQVDTLVFSPTDSYFKLGSLTFEREVPADATPEPGMLLPLGCGLAAVGLFRGASGARLRRILSRGLFQG